MLNVGVLLKGLVLIGCNLQSMNIDTTINIIKLKENTFYLFVLLIKGIKEKKNEDCTTSYVDSTVWAFE